MIASLDIFKGLVLLLLLALLMMFSLSPTVQEDAESATPEALNSDNEGDSATDGADGTDNEGDSVNSQGDVTLSIPTLLLTGVDLVGDKATFIGTGMPGSEIEVLVDGKIVGSSQIEDDGTWALTLQLDEQESVEVQVFMITDGEVTAVSERAILNFATSATIIDLPFLISPTQITTGKVTFSGIGSPSGQIQLLIDGQPTESAQIDENGIWFLTTELDEAGEIEVQAQIIDAEGNVIVITEPTTLTVTVAESG